MSSKLRLVYNYKRDSVLNRNIVGEDPTRDSLRTCRFKAFIQTYNHTLVRNLGKLN